MTEVRATNPLVDQFRKGGVPKDLRLMAAQGALPAQARRSPGALDGPRPRSGPRDPGGGHEVHHHFRGRGIPAHPQEPRDPPGGPRLGRDPSHGAGAAGGRAPEHVAPRRDDRVARPLPPRGARGARGHQPEAPPAAHVAPRGGGDEPPPQQRPAPAPARAARDFQDRCRGGPSPPLLPRPGLPSRSPSPSSPRSRWTRRRCRRTRPRPSTSRRRSARTRRRSAPSRRSTG